MSAELAVAARPAAGEPEGALVLCHGRGTDEHDLFPLLDALDPERRLLGRHAARRRSRCRPAAPTGTWCRASAIPDPETFTRSYERLTSWLDALPELVPPERTCSAASRRER